MDNILCLLIQVIVVYCLSKNIVPLFSVFLIHLKPEKKLNIILEISYETAIPQCMAQNPVTALYRLRPIRRIVGMTVIGPINLSRNPTIPVSPVTA